MDCSFRRVNSESRVYSFYGRDLHTPRLLCSAAHCGHIKASITHFVCAHSGPWLTLTAIPRNHSVEVKTRILYHSLLTYIKTNINHLASLLLNRNEKKVILVYKSKWHKKKSQNMTKCSITSNLIGRHRDIQHLLLLGEDSVKCWVYLTRQKRMM